MTHTKHPTIAALALALALTAACSGSSGNSSANDPKIDAVVAEYEALCTNPDEVDALRADIDNALDVLPQDQQAAYLDDLLEQATTMRRGAEQAGGEC